MAELSRVFEHLEPWIHDHGAAAIFLILTLESFGVPIPGESLLIFAAILAERGEIAFPILFLSAWCGAVTGDNIGYLIGKVLGHKLLQCYGKKVGLNPQGPMDLKSPRWFANSDFLAPFSFLSPSPLF